MYGTADLLRGIQESRQRVSTKMAVRYRILLLIKQASVMMCLGGTVRMAVIGVFHGLRFLLGRRQSYTPLSKLQAS